MRIWDLDPACLCDRHLVAEHAELHAVWSVITQNRRGYSAHPETRRWRGKLAALYRRHEALVEEMSKRGFSHRSPLDSTSATGLKRQDELIDSLEEQSERLRAKDCACFEVE
jgi:hypothetical protein